MENTITAQEYQTAAHTFASYGYNKMYPYFGLAEEAGEVCGKMAKFLRHSGGCDPHCERGCCKAEEKEQFRQDLIKELGDCLWMIAEIATVNGITLTQLMDSNIRKLSDRKQRGVIDGSGDNR